MNIDLPLCVGNCSGCCDQFIALLTSSKDSYVESEQQWIFGIMVTALECKMVDAIGPHVTCQLRSTLLYPGSHLVSFETRPTRRVNRHMLQDVILQCETSTKFTREARPRRVGPKRRGRAHESRSRFVDMNDQWTFQCQIQKRHPLRDETSTDETTPKPDRPRPHLGRNRVLAYGPVTFPHSGVSRVSASVRLMIQGHRHSARRGTSRVRQCHQLIRISEIKSESYTRCDAK